MLEVSVRVFLPCTEFSRWHSSRYRRVRLLNLTMTRWVITLFSSCFCLMLLEPLSPTDLREDEIPQAGPSHPISQSLDFPPVISTPVACGEQNLAAVEPPRGRTIFRQWLRRMGNRGPTLPQLGRLSGKSRKPADPRSPSHSSPRVDATKGPSLMAAGRPKTVSAVPDTRSEVGGSMLTYYSSGQPQDRGDERFVCLEFECSNSSHITA